MIKSQPAGAAGNRQYNGPGTRSRAESADWLSVAERLLGVTSLLLAAGMLVAGLWPFHAPRNQVCWIAGVDGLHFGRHGTVLSSGKFVAPPPNGPCSVEIWLQPDDIAGTTLFAFYQPGSGRQFSVGQSLSDLVLQIDSDVSRYKTRRTRLYVDGVFHLGTPLFITITSGAGQTDIYVNGVLARTASRFPLSSALLTGELIVADLPVVDNSWSGVLHGLAFYQQELSPTQVRKHVVTWTTDGKPAITRDERPLAVYVFAEHAGRIIHNLVPSGINLYIPTRYTVLDQGFLTPFWKEFFPTWSCLEDVLVNIAGFVPFGLVCCAYLALVCQFKRPALATVLLGFAISLTIEVLQSYLPTRDSGTNDLITNTWGTACGAWLYLAIPWRLAIANVSQRMRRRNVGG